MTESTTEPTRWRLHRGGIVNVWQYAEQSFDFSGGRAIFQGTNGSGKSRTLELLLPLCLDGDLRYLGSKGFDTVSMRRLMLDEYDGGPNRIGYAWIELHRVTPAGEEFLTCGIGVKASKTSQVEQIATSFDDLESIRENISRLRTADRALGTFLASYTDYALAGLRGAAERAGAAQEALRKGRQEATTLAGRLDAATSRRARPSSR